MNELSIKRFIEFFKEVNNEHEPFDWQIRLVSGLMETGYWPEGISLPTASGKSAVVEAHIFAFTEFLAGRGKQTPRRLFSVVNRRALSDNVFERANFISEAINASDTGILFDMKQLLNKNSINEDDSISPLNVVNIRGGIKTDKEWLSSPQKCAIIACTPEMFGSRMLFNGYGDSNNSKSRAAGMIGIDSIALIDEAHISRQLLQTCKDVSLAISEKMKNCDHIFNEGIKALQVCECTATPVNKTTNHITLKEKDLTNESLMKRVQTPKKLLIHRTDGYNKKESSSSIMSKYAKEIAELCIYMGEKQKQEGEENPVIACVFNWKKTAIAVAKELEKMAIKKNDVVCIVGGRRQADMKALRIENPGLFDSSQEIKAKYIVSTQAVEVGVDMDWSGLITELAPGEALAQRAGRLNRLGKRKSSFCVVIAPKDNNKPIMHPYHPEDLDESLNWVLELSKIENGGTINAGVWLSEAGGNKKLQPPISKLNRKVISRVFEAQIDIMASTSREHFSQIDLGFFIKDNLDSEDNSIKIAYRPILEDIMPGDINGETLDRMIFATSQISSDEYFSITKNVAQDIANLIAKEKAGTETYGFIIRGKETIKIENSKDAPKIIPGDSLLISENLKLVEHGVISDAKIKNKQDPVMKALENKETKKEYLVSEGILRIGPNHNDYQNSSFTVTDEARDETGKIIWQVLKNINSSETLKSSSPVGKITTLSSHQEEVAKRAEKISENLLTEEAKKALYLAGKYHDEGKKHHLFQAEVLANDSDIVLAKSKQKNKKELDKKTTYKRLLPVGWRHEQLSAAIAYNEVKEQDLKELIVRLVGTSHGRGRNTFPHGVKSLASGEIHNGINELFSPAGEWSYIIENTNNQIGHWGCAYLENILRSADGQISAEGK